MNADVIILGAREVVTLDGPAPDASRPHDEAPLGRISGGAVACAEGRIVAVGPQRDVERAITLVPGARIVDAHDALVAPGFIDAHTHALFAGDRCDEFASRLEGTSYKDIAAAGGGIARSVRQLRDATDEMLGNDLAQRLDRMRAFGVTTVEVKTGYGLDTASEVRCLRLIAKKAAEAATRVVPTFLPLHAVDPDLRATPNGRAIFLQRTLDETLPAAIRESPAFIDAYIDSTGFSVREATPVLEAARAAGIRAKLHVGQFADIGGAEFAAHLGAASADHLEHVSDAGLRAMAAAGVVGVLLPGAAFSLGQTAPDARRMRSLGVEIAVATDCNPGTSYTENLPLMATFAVRLMGLSIVEAWWSITRAAARALRRDDVGVLRAGARADIAILELSGWQALPYHFGTPLARSVVIDGRVVSPAMHAR